MIGVTAGYGGKAGASYGSGTTISSRTAPACCRQSLMRSVRRRVQYPHPCPPPLAGEGVSPATGVAQSPPPQAGRIRVGAMYRIGIDVGGTFTDLVAIDAGGATVLGKVPSTSD